MSNEIDFSSLKILIVDDEVYIRRLIIRLLKDLGVTQIIQAENGSEGLTRVMNSEGKLDLVISDIEMPIMNGLKFIEGVRKGIADEKSQDVAIIMLTSRSEKEFIQKAVQTGIQGYIAKPFSQTALEKKSDLQLGNL